MIIYCGPAGEKTGEGMEGENLYSGAGPGVNGDPNPRLFLSPFSRCFRHGL